jgi:hypothetical protein
LSSHVGVQVNRKTQSVSLSVTHASSVEVDNLCKEFGGLLTIANLSFGVGSGLKLRRVLLLPSKIIRMWSRPIWEKPLIILA